MESEKQSGDIVRAECCSAREEEEMETFFALIRRFGELRRKEGELIMTRGSRADAADHDPDPDPDHDHVERIHYNNNKRKIKWTVDDRFNRDQDRQKKKKKNQSIGSSSSKWVPRFQLEDFGEEIGCRRSSPPFEAISHTHKQKEVSINSKQLMLNIVGDNDDDDHCGLNLKLAL